MNKPLPNLVAATTALAPVRSRWPRHEDDELQAVMSVLSSGRVNALVHGDETSRFASEFAGFVGARHAVCVANGTVALEIALRALGVGPGDEVIVPARSFFATASCVLAVGAKPVFADIQPHSQNIDPLSVERMISPKTKAVICVHLAGWPCDMPALSALAERFGLCLIEDCAQAHGAAIAGRRVGAWGDAAAFSFCTDKIMSTGGEGGLVTFRHEAHRDAGWSYKDHGKNPAKLSDGKGKPGQFRYIHDAPGTNLRLTEMQAAIGRRQLAKLPGWLETRRRNAGILLSAWAFDERILLPCPEPGIEHAWYKFNIRLVDTGRQPIGEYRARVIERLHDRGIPAGTGSCPDMSREQAFDGIPIGIDGALPVANGIGGRTLMFPVDHTLDEDDMNRIADGLMEALDD